jgi:hypothetical protein
MPSTTEVMYPGEFLLSEANGERSRDTITVASGAGVIRPGAVLGRVTASGKFVLSPDTGADGSQTAIAVALYGCDATSADQKIAAMLRDCEVNSNMLSHAASVNDATKRGTKATQLAAVGIIVRT